MEDVYAIFGEVVYYGGRVPTVITPDNVEEKFQRGEGGGFVYPVEDGKTIRYEEGPKDVKRMMRCIIENSIETMGESFTIIGTTTREKFEGSKYTIFSCADHVVSVIIFTDDDPLRTIERELGPAEEVMKEIRKEFVAKEGCQIYERGAMEYGKVYLGFHLDTFAGYEDTVVVKTTKKDVDIVAPDSDDVVFLYVHKNGKEAIFRF